MHNPIQAGARQAVTRCVRVESNERVVIITDQETLHLARAIETEVSMAQAHASLFIMRDGKFCFGEWTLREDPVQ